MCSPHDAVRAFLDGLAIGPYFVPHPARAEKESRGSERETASSSR